MAKTHKYTGILGKPRESVLPAIDDPSYNPFDKKCQAAVRARMKEQEKARISALFKDCGVAEADPIAWHKVALVLAERHIKAFHKPSSPGRKKGILAADEHLMDEMAELIGSGHSISNAARILADRRGKSKQQAAIETHFHRTRSEWARGAALVKRWRQQLNAKRSSVAKSRG